MCLKEIGRLLVSQVEEEDVPALEFIEENEDSSHMQVWLHTQPFPSFHVLNHINLTF